MWWRVIASSFVWFFCVSFLPFFFRLNKRSSSKTAFVLQWTRDRFVIFTSYFPPFCQHSQPLEREKSFLSPFPKKQVTKMKILPASNGSTGASSSSSSTSSQVSGLKLGIVRLGRAAGKVNTSSSSSFACYHSPVILSRIQSTLSLFLSSQPKSQKIDIAIRYGGATLW